MLALAGLFVYLRVSDDLTETIDNGLRSRTDDLAAVVASSGGGDLQLRGGRLVEGEEVFSQILSRGGEVVASTLAPGSGPALEPALVDRARREPVIVERDVPGIEAKARILARPVDSAAGEVIVVAGASTDDRNETLSGLLSAFLVGAPLALILASAIGYLLARRALGPVAAMRRRAEQITLERSDERLPLPQAEDEVRLLGETLNAMLDRLEAALERERVFVADASHELRTPLAILRTELELGGRPGRSGEELRAAIQSAAEEVDRLSRLAEDLLVIARSDQGQLQIDRKRANVRDLLEAVGRRFDGRAGQANRTIVVEAPTELEAELDTIRIEQALGNLADNALRHGSGEVRLTARREDGSLVLEVSDQGGGLPAEFRDEAFERFTRADEGRTGGGAGLGLAIVRAIAAAHGGQVAVADRPGDSVTTLRLALPDQSHSS